MVARTSRNTLVDSRRNQRPREFGRHASGFTLVELLMVIAIVGLLATFVLVALAGANQSAKESRTTAQLVKINELLQDKWQSYQYRNMPPLGNTAGRKIASARRGQYIPVTNPSSGQPFRSFDEWLVMSGGGYRSVHLDRWMATHEVMRMELPCTLQEVVGPNTNRHQQSLLLDPLDSRLRERSVPALSIAYYTRAKAAVLGNDLSNWSRLYQSSECLFLILSQMRDGDSSALEYFSEAEIGDTDGDGMNEILDGWGRPILWLRWAPGFRSTLQVTLGEDPQQADMFDPMEVGPSYNPQFANNPQNVRALFPLIYSSGPDGNYGMKSVQEDAEWITVQSNPFHPSMSTVGLVESQSAATDNITNHLLTTR